MPRMADFAATTRGDGLRSPRDGCALPTCTWANASALPRQLSKATPWRWPFAGFSTWEPCWEGTAGEKPLKRITPEKPPRDWPRTPQGMGGRLKRLIPPLEQTGVSLRHLSAANGHVKGTRRICLPPQVSWQ